MATTNYEELVRTYAASADRCLLASLYIDNPCLSVVDKEQCVFSVDYCRKAGTPIFPDWERNVGNVTGAYYPWMLPLFTIESPAQDITFHVEVIGGKTTSAWISANVGHEFTKLFDMRVALQKRFPGIKMDSMGNPRVFVKSAKLESVSTWGCTDDISFRLLGGQTETPRPSSWGPTTPAAPAPASSWPASPASYDPWTAKVGDRVVVPGKHNGYLPCDKGQLYDLKNSQVANPWVSRMALLDRGTVMAIFDQYKMAGVTRERMLQIPLPPRSSIEIDYSTRQPLWLATWAILSFFRQIDDDSRALWIRSTELAVEVGKFVVETIGGGCVAKVKSMSAGTYNEPVEITSDVVIIRAEFLKGLFEAMMRVADTDGLFANMSSVGLSAVLTTSKETAAQRVADKSALNAHFTGKSVSVQALVRVQLVAWGKDGNVIVPDCSGAACSDGKSGGVVVSGKSSYWGALPTGPSDRYSGIDFAVLKSYNDKQARNITPTAAESAEMEKFKRASLAGTAAAPAAATTTATVTAASASDFVAGRPAAAAAGGGYMGTGSWGSTPRVT